MLSNQGSANEKVKYLGLRCFAVPVALPQVLSLSNWHVIWSFDHKTDSLETYAIT